MPIERDMPILELWEDTWKLAQEKGIEKEELVSAFKISLRQAYLQSSNPLPIARVEIDADGALKILGKREEGDAEIDCTPEATELLKICRSALTLIRQRPDILPPLIRHAEDEELFSVFLPLKGQLATGIVQQDKKDEENVHVSIGKTEALLPKREQTPGEEYRHGQILRVYVVAVSRGANGPEVIVSRCHPNLVLRLFEREVPEMTSGDVSILKIAREAGSRTKIATKSNTAGLNGKGTFIGPEGSRVRAVVSELRGEKVDIVDYSDDPAAYIASALSPARVASVQILSQRERKAVAFAPESQLRLAIGREGQNARLAARLTGWKIAISSSSR